MPRLSKAARARRLQDARADVSPRTVGGSADSGSVIGTGTISAGELAAAAPAVELPPELGQEFSSEADRRAGGSVAEQAEAAADAAAGEPAPELGGAAPTPDFVPPALTPEQLLALVETGKGLLVTLAGKAWKIPDDRVAELAKLDPSTRATLAIFAPDAVRYLPALSSNAPILGAVCFAGFLALDLYQTSLRLRAERAELAAPAGSPAAPRDAHGSRIVGAENLPTL